MDVDFELCPLILVRLPALAIERARALNLEATLELHRALEAERSGHAERRVEWCERLATLVPGAPVAERRLLLGLRRAIHHDHVERARALGARAADEPTRARVLDAYLESRSRLERAAEERAEAYERELAESAAHQVALLAEPPLRLAFELAHPRLLQTIQRTARGAEPRQRARKALRRGLALLWRSAYKATPRGYFASSALGVACGGAEAPSVELRARRARVQPDRAMLQQVAEWLLRRPCSRGQARLRLNALAMRDAAGAVGFAAEPSRAADADFAGLFHQLAPLPTQCAPFSELERWFGAELLERALDARFLELDAGTSDAEADDLEVLSRCLEGAALGEEEIALAEQLSSYRRAVRQLAGGSLPRFETCEQAVGVRDLLHEDTYLADPVPVATARWQPFLRSAARASLEPAGAAAGPEARVLEALFARLSPADEPLPWLEFYAAYRRECERLGLGSDHWCNTPALARAWGLALDDAGVAIRRRLHDELGRAGRLVQLDEPEVVAAPGPARRLALRFSEVDVGGSRPCFSIALWGSDRMSLLPRYLGLPCASTRVAEARRWLARWPALADLSGAPGGNPDLRPRLTRRAIAGPGARCRPGDVPLRELWVQREPASERLALRVGRDGEAVVPAFLGVSVPARLHPVTQLLLHFGARGPSFLDSFYRELHGLLASLAQGATRAIVLPPILLGPHLLLSPALALIPRGAWPRLRAPVDQAAYFHLRDWLERLNAPAGVVQVRALGGSADAQWLDLRHPEGMNQLLRQARVTPTLVLMDPHLPATQHSLRGVDGDYRTEFYVELAASASGAAADVDAARSSLRLEAESASQHV